MKKSSVVFNIIRSFDWFLECIINPYLNLKSSEVIDRILNQFREEIKPIESSNLNDSSNIESGIKISRKYLQQLRVLIRENDFQNVEEEIKFFKKQKPFVYSRLKFYARLYNFLVERPAGSIKSQRNFIDSQIKKLQNYHKRNIDFVKYYYEKETVLDEFYFVRGNDNLNLVTRASHFYTDAEFATSHDNAVAQIMAYDLLINHYNQELVSLGMAKALKNDPNELCSQLNLEWTASKTDLVELIYALQASGAIRDGAAGIKEMATACEQIFGLDLGNYYKTYIEIRTRKFDRTNFISKLKTSLETKMQKDDMKPL
ncbi:MAG TPA: RteC domain-containing protein [Salinimicrobium sp.]|nr:RteC domain-containing protein [Salinimicrobium sp.]